MKVYSYNNKGWYTGETKTQPSPLEPGIDLMPAFATPINPPDYDPATSLPFFDGTTWKILESPKVTEQKQLAQKQAQEEQAKQDKLAQLTYKERREMEYPSINACVEALLEKLTENSPDKLDQIIQQRALVKAKYPAPI